MELQFDKLPIKALESPVRDVRNMELTQELRLPDGMPDVGRILMAWGQVLIRSKEWNRDSVGISGGVNISVLYIPEDGTEVRPVETWIPLQMKWDLPGEHGEGRIIGAPLLRHVDCRGLSARKMMIRADVACYLRAMVPTGRDLYRPGALPEDVELLTRSYPVRIPKEAGEKQFLLDEELSMPLGKPVIERILCHQIVPAIGECRVMDDKIVFKGNCGLVLLYRCPEGMIHSATFDIPISQLAQLDDHYGQDASGQIHIALTNGEVDSLEGKIRVKAGLVGQYVVDDRQMIQVAEDAYSPDRKVEFILEELRIPSVLEDREESILGEYGIPGLMGDPIQGYFLPGYPSQSRKGDQIQLHIPGQFQMIYREEDGTVRNAAGKWERYWDLPAGENVELDVFPQLNLPVRANSEGDGMELSASLDMRIQAYGQTRIPMVTGLSLGEVMERDPNRPSMILTRGNGEDLWQMAKRYGTTRDAIKTYNGLKDEISDDRMLLIPIP